MAETCLLRISVITVCLNSAATIERCLLSVAMQTYSNIEHIVIDGGSTDGTLDILQSYSGVISILISEPDFGIYDAMNKGVRLATGDVVCVLNSDDCYDNEGVLQDVINCFQSSDYAVVLGDVVFCSETNLGERRVLRRYPARRFKPDRLKFGWMPPHPGFFARKYIYNTFGYYDVSYRIAGDFEFIARIFSKSSLQFAFLNKTAVRMSLGGVSTAGVRNTIVLNREVLRACRANGIRTNGILLMMKYPIKFWDWLSPKIF